MTYGCYNRKPHLRATAHTRLIHWGTKVWAERELIPNRGERLCQYTKTALGQADAGCVGCYWRDDEKGLREFDPVI